MENKLITIEFLKKKHPPLNTKGAYSLMLFCKNNSIKYQSCYGDGSIMFPKWVNSLFIK